MHHKFHRPWQAEATQQLWVADPDYEKSYNEKQTTNALPLPIKGPYFHRAFATGWVNTNMDMSWQKGDIMVNTTVNTIEIDMDQKKIHSNGEIIADVRTLESGELIAMSLDGNSQSKLCISKDRAYLFSQGGSTWQRRRLFKKEWARLCSGAESKPLPFQETDSICFDTDSETQNQCLTNAAANSPLC